YGIEAYYERHEVLDFTDVNNYAGIVLKRPIMGVMLSLFLFSLAGIPPLVGFFGKYLVFAAAINAGMVGLAVIGVLASAASVYYYLCTIVCMYFREPHKDVTFVQAGLIFKHN